MDLKQIEYIVQIARENNITRAAEKLFITQSALNQQLLKLEKELGTPLFFRSRTDWRLTKAGEVYIKNANEILRIKKETYNIIHDIAQTKFGHITVGFPPGRGIPMFTHVYPSFHQEFPKVEVEPIELSVKQQITKILQGDIDIGFLTLYEDKNPNLQQILICEEDIVLAIPGNHPLARYSTSLQTTIDISQVRDEPFVLIYKESSLRVLLDEVFKEAGFKPKVLFETSSNSAVVNMVATGLCCGIIPYYYVNDCNEDIAYFYLSNYPTWKTVAAYRSGSYLSEAAQHFIKIAAEYWKRNIPPMLKTKNKRMSPNILPQ